eukprot:c22385_g2_i1 orf=606-803(-)
MFDCLGHSGISHSCIIHSLEINREIKNSQIIDEGPFRKLWDPIWCHFSGPYLNVSTKQIKFNSII